MPYEYNEQDYLNNSRITPEEFYTLQSRMWGQGWFERGESIKYLLKEEQARTKLGFIQYDTIAKILGNQ